MSGYWICSFCTTGASCVVGTCIKISGIPVKEHNMTLPQLSARYALGGTCGLEMYANWHISDLVIVLYLCTFDGFQHRLYRRLHVHGDDDNFVDELQLDESPRFFWTAWTFGTCLCNLTGTSIILSMCCFCELHRELVILFDLCPDQVSFPAPSL